MTKFFDMRRHFVLVSKILKDLVGMRPSFLPWVEPFLIGNFWQPIMQRRVMKWGPNCCCPTDPFTTLDQEIGELYLV